MSERTSYSGKRQRGKIWIGLFFVVCVGYLAYFIATQQPPLNQEEKKLVGKWAHETTEMVMAFHKDRSFRSEDGEFAGKWWIESGELKMKMWRAKPDHFGNKYADFFANPISNLQDSWNAKAIVLNIRHIDEMNRAILTSPGAEDFTIRRVH